MLIKSENMPRHARNKVYVDQMLFSPTGRMGAGRNFPRGVQKYFLCFKDTQTIGMGWPCILASEILAIGLLN